MANFIYKVFIKPLRTVFPREGYDPINLTENGQDKKQFVEAAENSDQNHGDFDIVLLEGVTSILGIPNRIRSENNISVTSIAKNSVGWRDQAPRWKNLLFALPHLLYNLALWVLKIGVNVLKIGTELLPFMLAELCEYGCMKMQQVMQNKETPFVVKGLAAVGFALAGIGCVLFKSVHFIGRAITSPVTSLRAAWKLGEDTAGQGLGGKILGGTLVCLSAAVTLVAYLVAFPLLAKFVAGAVATHLPLAVTQVVSTVSNTLGNIIAPLLKTVGISTALAPPLGLSLLGGLFTSLGDGCKKLKDLFCDWWFKDSPKHKIVLGVPPSHRPKTPTPEVHTNTNTSTSTVLAETKKTKAKMIKNETMPASQNPMLRSALPRPPAPSSRPPNLLFGRVYQPYRTDAAPSENTPTQSSTAAPTAENTDNKSESDVFAKYDCADIQLEQEQKLEPTPDANPDESSRPSTSTTATQQSVGDSGEEIEPISTFGLGTPQW